MPKFMVKNNKENSGPLLTQRRFIVVSTRSKLDFFYNNGEKCDFLTNRYVPHTKLSIKSKIEHKTGVE